MTSVSQGFEFRSRLQWQLQFIMTIPHSVRSILEKAANSVGHLIGLLGSSAHQSDEDYGDEIAPSGGAYNYRIGNLDDGTDPIGWYEDN